RMHPPGKQNAKTNQTQHQATVKEERKQMKILAVIEDNGYLATGCFDSSPKIQARLNGGSDVYSLKLDLSSYVGVAGKDCRPCSFQQWYGNINTADIPACLN